MFGRADGDVAMPTTRSRRTAEQLKKAQHTSTLYINPTMVDVAEKVAQLTPGRLQKSYFTNSGSEANETAIIAARMYTGNMEIITLRHAYSGRTQGAMSLTAHGNWRMGGVWDPYIRHVKNRTCTFPAFDPSRSSILHRGPRDDRELTGRSRRSWPTDQGGAFPRKPRLSGGCMELKNTAAFFADEVRPDGRARDRSGLASSSGASSRTS